MGVPPAPAARPHAGSGHSADGGEADATPSMPGRTPAGPKAPAGWSPKKSSRGKVAALRAPLLSSPNKERCIWDLEEGLSSQEEEEAKQHRLCCSIVSALLLGLLVGGSVSLATILEVRHMAAAAETHRAMPWSPPAPAHHPNSSSLDTDTAHRIRRQEEEERRVHRKKFKVLGRDVLVYEPPSRSIVAQDSARLPAVLVLHGSYGTALGIAESAGLEQVSAALASGFLVVYPEMAEPRGEMWGFQDPEEEAFFRAVVDMLDSQFAIQRNEVFVCGHSVGGTMALYLQNNLPDLFQAAASVEAGVGHMQFWNNHSRGRPTMLIWNHNDPVLAEFGGEGLYSQTVSTLRRHDSTGSGPASVTPLPTSSPDLVFVQQLLWRELDSQPALAVISWASAKPTHAWPSNASFPGGSLDAAALIWEFFSSTRILPGVAAHDN